MALWIGMMRMATKRLTNSSCTVANIRSRQLSSVKSEAEESLDAARRELSALGGEGSVTLDKEESSGIAIITIQHERRRNALSPSMMVQLSDAVAELERWKSGRGLLVWGGTSGFCSGGDLSFIGDNVDSADAGRRMALFMADATRRMHTLPIISAAVVCGAAVGGGAELTTACDFRFMADNGSLHWAQARMGLSPGWGGGGRLVRLIGRAAALNVLTGDQVLGPEDATTLGLCDGVLGPAEGALQVAKQWLVRRTCWDVPVINAVKRMVVAADGDEKLAAEVEKEQFLLLWGGDSQRVALQRRKDTQPKNKTS